MHGRFRLLHPLHGCDPEHLIFCLRHRVHLNRHFSKSSHSYRGGFTCALEDLFPTLRFSFPDSICLNSLFNVWIASAMSVPLTWSLRRVQATPKYHRYLGIFPSVREETRGH